MYLNHGTPPKYQKDARSMMSAFINFLRSKILIEDDAIIAPDQPGAHMSLGQYVAK